MQVRYDDRAAPFDVLQPSVGVEDLRYRRSLRTSHRELHERIEIGGQDKTIAVGRARQEEVSETLHGRWEDPAIEIAFRSRTVVLVEIASPQLAGGKRFDAGP